jgi:hypothetical protein
MRSTKEKTHHLLHVRDEAHHPLGPEEVAHPLGPEEAHHLHVQDEVALLLNGQLGRGDSKTLPYKIAVSNSL